MPEITVEAVNARELPGVLGVSIPYVPTAFGAEHTLLEGELVERLGLPSLASLSILTRETYRKNGIWGPTVADADRYFAVNIGEFLAVVAKPHSGHAAKVTLKPIYGLFVPAGYAVALQTVHDNRSSHLVISRRQSHAVVIDEDTPEFVGCWNTTEIDPALNEYDTRLAHPSQ